MEFLLTVLLGGIFTVIVHELSHGLSAGRRMKGIVIGWIRGKPWYGGVGLIICPIRSWDLVMPLLLVPLISFVVFGTGYTTLYIIICNILGSAADLINLMRIEKYGNMKYEQVKEWVNRNVRGVVVWF